MSKFQKAHLRKFIEVEKKYADIYNKPNKYISTTNIVLTFFSILVLFFGFLLIYNMGSSKKKNE